MNNAKSRVTLATENSQTKPNHRSTESATRSEKMGFFERVLEIVMKMAQ